jgi:hypothetical protein
MFLLVSSITAAAPQQRKGLSAELREERSKVRDDQGSEAGMHEERAKIREAQRHLH